MALRWEHLEYGLIDMCKYIKELGIYPKTIVEVGVFEGESTQIFINEFPDSTILCIDPWKIGFDDNDILSKCQNRMDEAERNFDIIKEKYSQNIIKLKGISSSFESILTKYYPVDMTYIDGCHTYDAVKEDIAFWKPKTKHLLCGHDFTSWIPVQEAVIESIGNPDKTFQDSSWIKKLI